MGLKKELLLLLLATTLPAERNCQGAPERVEAAAGLESPGRGEYGVKLCGREFIRAVIFTCGGSRWKRISAPPPRAEFIQTGNDNELENIKLQSVLDPKLDQLQTISQSAQQQTLKNMFNLYNDNEYVPTSDSFSEYINQAKDVPKSRDETRLANSMGSNYFLWGKYPRKKRDSSLGVAGLCCKWGCTKTEISTLC
nr:relaxin-3-like [Pogona vitticeps]